MEDAAQEYEGAISKQRYAREGEARAKEVLEERGLVLNGIGNEVSKQQ